MSCGRVVSSERSYLGQGSSSAGCGENVQELLEASARLRGGVGRVVEVIEQHVDEADIDVAQGRVGSEELAW
jgi:hypothetical protein